MWTAGHDADFQSYSSTAHSQYVPLQLIVFPIVMENVYGYMHRESILLSWKLYMSNEQRE